MYLPTPLQNHVMHVSVLQICFWLQERIQTRTEQELSRQTQADAKKRHALDQDVRQSEGLGQAPKAFPLTGCCASLRTNSSWGASSVINYSLFTFSVE